MATSVNVRLVVADAAIPNGAAATLLQAVKLRRIVMQDHSG